jgi:hypothetical protein
MSRTYPDDAEKMPDLQAPERARRWFDRLARRIMAGGDVSPQVLDEVSSTLRFEWAPDEEDPEERNRVYFSCGKAALVLSMSDEELARLLSVEAWLPVYRKAVGDLVRDPRSKGLVFQLGWSDCHDALSPHILRAAASRLPKHV